MILATLSALLLSGCMSPLNGITQESNAIDSVYTYSQIWSVTRTSEPPGLNQQYEQFMSIYDLYEPCIGDCDWTWGTQIWDAVPLKSNGTVMTGYSNIFKCMMEVLLHGAGTSDDEYTPYMFLAIEDGAWPVATGTNPQWPSTIRCTAGGYNVDGIAGNDSITGEVSLGPAVNPDWITNLGTVTVATGKTITMYKNAAGDEESVKLQAELQSGTYITGWVQAKKPSPNQTQNWTGVKAWIYESNGVGPDLIWYDLKHSNTMNPDTGTNGKLPISRNGTVVQSPITVVRQ